MLRLQHDYNLIARLYGKDKAYANHKPWASGSDKQSNHPENVKYWFLVDNNAKVQVCVGEFDVNHCQTCNDAGMKTRYIAVPQKISGVTSSLAIKAGFKDATR